MPGQWPLFFYIPEVLEGSKKKKKEKDVTSEFECLVDTCWEGRLFRSALLLLTFDIPCK